MMTFLYLTLSSVLCLIHISRCNTFPKHFLQGKTRSADLFSPSKEMSDCRFTGHCDPPSSRTSNPPRLKPPPPTKGYISMKAPKIPFDSPKADSKTIPEMTTRVPHVTKSTKHLEKSKNGQKGNRKLRILRQSLRGYFLPAPPPKVHVFIRDRDWQVADSIDTRPSMDLVMTLRHVLYRQNTQLLLVRLPNCLQITSVGDRPAVTWRLTVKNQNDEVIHRGRCLAANLAIYPGYSIFLVSVQVLLRDRQLNINNEPEV